MLLLPLSTVAQDTIYSYLYPNGVAGKVIVNGFTYYKIKISGIEDEITLSKDHVISFNGKTNAEYITGNDIVVPTEPFTGRIQYKKILDFKEVKTKILYDAVNRLPSNVIEYHLISTDDKEYSYVQFRGRFEVNFFKGPADVIFSLDVHIKDGKIKYDYHDFIYLFKNEKQKTKQNWFTGTYNTTTDTKKILKPLEFYYRENYIKANRNLWGTVNDNINSSIQSLTKICQETTETKGNW